jgi:hypothetical protein
MADKDFKVKNKLFVNGLSQASGVILATNNNLDSHTNVPTQYGGTGTTTSPSAGQILYSAAGSTYAPTDLSSVAAPSNSPTFTGNVVLPSTTTYSGTNVQTLLDAKSNKVKSISTKVADYTLTAADSDSIIEFNSSSDLNLTLPTYSSAALSYGDTFDIVNRGSGKVNILNQTGTLSLSSYATTGTFSGTVYSSLYANNLYLINASTFFYRSSDAITWTSISAFTAFTTTTSLNQRIAYGAGLYIIAAGTGIWSSSDGISWTQRLSGVSTVRAVKYANNKFIAGGTDGVMFSSTDGITWTSLGTVASLATQDFNNIEYFSALNTWFATINASPWLIKSTDNGSTWTSVSGAPGFASGILSTNGSILIISNATLSSSFRTTTDGSTFNTVNFSASSYPGKVIYDGTQFIMGYVINTSPVTLYQYSSSNGTSWSVQSSISNVSLNAANSLMVGASGQYIYLGQANTGYTSGSVTTSYLSKNNISYLPPKGKMEIYNYNQNQFFINGDIGETEDNKMMSYMGAI